MGDADRRSQRAAARDNGNHRAAGLERGHPRTPDMVAALRWLRPDPDRAFRRWRWAVCDGRDRRL